MYVFNIKRREISSRDLNVFRERRLRNCLIDFDPFTRIIHVDMTTIKSSPIEYPNVNCNLNLTTALVTYSEA